MQEMRANVRGIEFKHEQNYSISEQKLARMNMIYYTHPTIIQNNNVSF